MVLGFVFDIFLIQKSSDDHKYVLALSDDRKVL